MRALDQCALPPIATTATASASGRLTASVVLWSVFPTATNRGVGCSPTPGSCVILVSRGTGSGFVGYLTPLTFAPPGIRATPAVGLTPGGTVTATANLLTPGSWTVTVCDGSFAANPTFGWALVDCAGPPVSRAATAPVTGSFSVALSIPGTFSSISGRTVTCTGGPARCVLVAGRGGSSNYQAVATPISFGPPTLMLTPSTLSAPGQTATLSGVGFEPGGPVALTACRSGIGPDIDLFELVTACASGQNPFRPTAIPGSDTRFSITVTPPRGWVSFELIGTDCVATTCSIYSTVPGLPEAPYRFVAG